MKEINRTDSKFTQQIFLFLLVMFIASGFSDLFPQNIGAKPTRQTSFEAFSKGNYELAYKEFSELLLTYSKDPLYKYYSGVCLVKLKKKPAEAVTLLKEALRSSGAVKTLPSDAMLYLGQAQQMNGRYTEAIESFNLFTDQAGRKEAKESGVPEFIQQCNEKNGEITEPEIKPVEIVKNDKVEVNQKENQPVLKEVIPQPVKMDTSAKVNLPSGYEKILNEALDFQFKADSLSSLNEPLAASYQKSADQKYSEAQVAINPQQENIPPKEIIQPAYNMVNKDSVKQSDNKVVNAAEKQSDTLKQVGPIIKETVETFAFFEVLTKPVSDPDENITIDPEVPAGLIYRIQIAVFRNPASYAYFMGITPVYGFKIIGTDKTIYYAGMFRRFSDANKALAKVKTKGFKDAFVVALSGNKPVSADRAAILEKEWGKKPFICMVKSVPETPIDTIPPTLSFRVEVIRSLEPLKEDIVEGIKKMAGNRGLNIQPLDDGNIAYLIGKFITFESAAEYADLLIRNGYRETRVVAWLGEKEIAIETARQLFETLE
ncbi:MAG: hypothetical protein NT144_01160 [Bacteroidia bacterium]|nr:hypothetical protein [Bacteroidia bacterium]